jgi:uncharacterized membrane protein
MPFLEHLIQVEDQTLVLLIILVIVATFLVLLLLAGYIVFIRYRSGASRLQADQAHEGMLAFTQAESPFHSIHESLRDIDKSLTRLAITGPDQVIRALADIRGQLEHCQDMFEKLAPGWIKKQKGHDE